MPEIVVSIYSLGLKKLSIPSLNINIKYRNSTANTIIFLLSFYFKNKNSQMVSVAARRSEFSVL